MGNIKRIGGPVWQLQSLPLFIRPPEMRVGMKKINKFNVYGRCRTVNMVNMVKEIKGVYGVLGIWCLSTNLSDLKICRSSLLCAGLTCVLCFSVV